MYAQDSIELLKNSGIDFACNEARGIDVLHFGELLMSSGIVLNDEVSILPTPSTIVWLESPVCCPRSESLYNSSSSLLQNSNLNRTND